MLVISFSMSLRNFLPQRHPMELGAKSMLKIKKKSEKTHQPDLTAQKGKVQNRCRELYPFDVTNHFVLQKKKLQDIMIWLRSASVEFHFMSL